MTIRTRHTGAQRQRRAALAVVRTRPLRRASGSVTGSCVCHLRERAGCLFTRGAVRRLPPVLPAAQIDPVRPRPVPPAAPPPPFCNRPPPWFRSRAVVLWFCMAGVSPCVASVNYSMSAQRGVSAHADERGDDGRRPRAGRSGEGSPPTPLTPGRLHRPPTPRGPPPAGSVSPSARSGQRPPAATPARSRPRARGARKVTARAPRGGEREREAGHDGQHYRIVSCQQAL